ncbi:MAG TPA: nitrile hydratase subunit beta [Pseudomonadales bacterium]
MDGIHDLGGRQGFGEVVREDGEPVFHARWEAFVFTLQARMFAEGMVANVDQFRHAIERIDPIAYLTHGYYGRWLGGLETLLVESGSLDPAVLTERVLALGGSASDRVAARPKRNPDVVPARTRRRASRELPAAPAFSVGDLVRTAATPVSGHTRLPAYARGRLGTVVALQGGWVLPDSNAHGRGEHAQHLYCVRFEGAELWGDEAEPGQAVHLDLFESYLTKAAHEEAGRS